MKICTKEYCKVCHVIAKDGYEVHCECGQYSNANHTHNPENVTFTVPVFKALDNFKKGEIGFLNYAKGTFSKKAI